jgi:NTP pyrophosphatase (non-canonical NTP hydrolase)
MEFEEIVERAREVRRLYEAAERDAYGRPWSVEELTLGLVGDVGDVAKLVQAYEGVRKIDDAQARLEHELADVLWAIIAIAEQCDVDLERAFTATMDELVRELGA